MKPQTPFKDLIPPLSSDEKERLAADVKANGVRVPVDITEDGVVLDGHHRLEIDPNAPVNIIRGLTKPEQMAWAIRSNFNRRNLSPDQKKAIVKQQRKLALEMKKQKMTQADIGKALGVAQKTVSVWLDISNIPGYKAYIPDSRVKIPPQHKAAVASRVRSGETQAQVAADFGITQPRVAQIVKSETKRKKRKAEVEEAAKKIKSISGFYHGDFRRLADKVRDESVDLIFTDPPYDDESICLYGHLAEFASAKLKPGGWCLAYSGQSFLPEYYSAMIGGNLAYAWTFAITHSGGDLRFRKFKLQSSWKPILGFYKPPLNAWWDWFKDVATGGKEKDSHKWQQAEAEAAHFITHMTPKGGMVCDPFAGSGTTLIVAKEHGFCYCGFEIDKKHYDTAKVRLA